VLVDAKLEAVHWSILGPADAPDADIMAHARQDGLIVLTNDLDFGAILAATGGEKPSVVQIRADDVRPNVIGRQVVAALFQMADELEKGALLTIDPGRTRLTMLPLRSSRPQGGQPGT
jgi:predicted nuclease of predicted toxin-antitoxin system